MLHELLHRGDEDRLEAQVRPVVPRIRGQRVKDPSLAVNQLFTLRCRESKIASSEKMRIGGTAEMAWMQICDPSDKEKGHYSIEISDGVQTHTRTFDLSGQGTYRLCEDNRFFFLNNKDINAIICWVAVDLYLEWVEIYQRA